MSPVAANDQRLTETSLLRDVPPGDHAAVARVFTIQKVERRARIFHVGETARHLYVLLEGVVLISYFSLGGDEKIIDVCLPDDIFGALFLGKYRLRIGTARAQTDCTVASVSKDDLFGLIGAYPQIGIALVTLFADQQREALARLHALMHFNARHRFLGTLLSLARRQKGPHPGDNVLLPASLTQEDLANIACMNRTTASLLINQLCREGTLSRSARQIIVHIQKVEEVLRTAGVDILE